MLPILITCTALVAGYIAGRLHAGYYGLRWKLMAMELLDRNKKLEGRIYSWGRRAMQESDKALLDQKRN